MAGRGILGFPKSNELAVSKTTSCSLKDQAKRTILRNVRSQGHTYVELREDGKKSIFFCTLCLAPCYSDCVLFDHLKGNLHNQRLSTAKVTLLGPNPWPFNDGVVFFNNPTENDDDTVISNGNQSRLLESQDSENNLAIVTYGENLESCANGHIMVDELGHQNENPDSAGNLAGSGENCAVLIPGVRAGDEIANVEVREVGYGLISVRFREKDGVSNDISRIWCEWLGKKTIEDEDFLKVPEHDFAIVTFSYNNFSLGRMGLHDDVKALLCSSPAAEMQNGDVSSRKRRKSFSDPEDSSENLSNQYDSCGEDSSASAVTSLMLDQYDDQLLQTRFISNKAIRRELRRQQRIAAERMCDICQHKMLPGKDVATLMNVKTGRLACSSRNTNGAFHLFHTSCLIHWVLLCEVEKCTNQSEAPKVKRRSRRKAASKCNEVLNDSEVKAFRTPINRVICPECQGTGTMIDGEDEKPTVPLSKMFKYKIKVSDARRAWMKSPEVLGNCSTGFHFPSPAEETIQETVEPLKFLRFYGAH
ncbi:uncharacterized protein LOC21394829 [Morus notabilis]|uniref:uncharacterized protein LOC21394829 n=1 Tax=Morus notabilis TaxID=981085 RepID=UPI000CECFC74|nr:uncharacterized protein LOC21394829 [Morus notabilis]